MAKITHQQQRFIDEYLVDLNATQAAIRAGYSEKTAAQQGERLLRKVEIASAVQLKMDKLSEATNLTAEQIINELRLLGFSNAQDFFTDDGYLRSIVDLPREVAACIQSFEVVTRQTGEVDEDGNKEVERVYKVKFYDKMKGLELLGRHMVLFSDKIVHEVTEDFRSTDDVLKEVARLEEEMARLNTMH